MQVADLFEDIHDAVRSDRLALPSLPDVALQMHRAAKDPNCDFGTIGRVLKRDTAMAAHLIRLANGPLYASRVPVTNVRSAVHRIGVPGVCNLVTTLALRNLFRAPNKQLAKLFRELWRQSTDIAALTCVLATSCAGFDPDDALLAGLLQDIGAVTLLGQLGHTDAGAADPATVTAAIEEWSPRLGTMVLTHWGFDQRYIDVARARHDWHVDSLAGTALVDVVTAARLHFYHDTAIPGDWPAFETIPAYRKLPARTLTEKGALQLLVDAADEVNQVRSLLRD